MKKLHWFLGAFMSLFILAGCGSTAHVQKDESVDFSKIKTYAWVRAEKEKGINPRKLNDMVDNKIRRSVDKNLQANGWREVNTNPDVLLVYDVDVQKETRNVSDPVYSQPMTRWFYNPYRRSYVPIYYPSEFMGYNNSKEIVNEGTLTLTVLNADTEKTIWQGWTTSEINGRRMTDKEIDSNVKAIVKKLG
ncbi:MAG: DUF4136 domain-containing protein [Bacteroidota bacterium]